MKIYEKPHNERLENTVLKNKISNRRYCPSCKGWVCKRVGHTGKIWCKICSHLLEK